MSARLLIDLDGVVVDLMGAAVELGYLDHMACRWYFEGCCTALTANEVFNHTSLFLDASPIEGAIAGVNTLRNEGLDVRFLSTPWPTNHASASAKYQWVEKWFDDPTLLTLTHDKTLVPGAVLIDDRPGLVGPWLQVVYPQPWNDSAEPTWLAGLAFHVQRLVAR